jgi:hypothetical protein
MNMQAVRTRYRAVSMGFAAFLDGRYVEMRILTDAGEAVTVTCDGDSIFAVQRHIEQMGRDCPEISSWKAPPAANSWKRPALDSAEGAAGHDD